MKKANFCPSRRKTSLNKKKNAYKCTNAYTAYIGAQGVFGHNVRFWKTSHKK